MTEQEERWTIDICGRCRKRVFASGTDWKCEHCGHTLREVGSIEVVPASQLHEARTQLEKLRRPGIELALANAQTRAESAEAQLEELRVALRQIVERIDAHEQKYGGDDLMHGIRSQATATLALTHSTPPSDG